MIGGFRAANADRRTEEMPKKRHGSSDHDEQA